MITVLCPHNTWRRWDIRSDDDDGEAHGMETEVEQPPRQPTQNIHALALESSKYFYDIHMDAQSVGE